MRRHSPAWFVLLFLRVALGCVFLYATYTKLRQPFVLFAMAIDAYKLVPESVALLLARALPWAELLLGLALIAGLLPRFTSSAATALLALFFGVMLRSYHQGQQINCGCFGIGEAISPRTLARDGALLAFSLALTMGAFFIARRRRAAAPAAPSGAQPALAGRS
jgi:uncharacterized membrane protein YphA (DoxX/SURF4 family)